MPKPKGVFCVEGEWDSDLTKRRSVLPTLDMLERLGSLQHIHKSAVTAEQFRYFLEQWSSKRYSAYEVGFFALHGAPSELWLSKSHSTSLDEVAGWMSGRWQGKRIYIGGCSVLRGSDAYLADFLYRTGASMVCGFTKQIDWIESAAFETVILDRLVNSGKVNSVEQLASSARWAPLANHLGFRVVYANGSSVRIPSMRAGGTGVSV
ncbi:hypothetical protein GA0070606_0886 [Micromonospora citrea]|uniref:CHAT domain-containing protein n=1 Tax=Micromonospora citrea TaxID=47855 RepID=A0A1C6TVS9_9ACTN|nr:hypothetical protein [Micromonospora citrea]SCL45920.1 hypothetical protein GA0070606_0886 [Micromonospora citrea]